jgi:hypothetical protein
MAGASKADAAPMSLIHDLLRGAHRRVDACVHGRAVKIQREQLAALAAALRQHESAFNAALGGEALMIVDGDAEKLLLKYDLPLTGSGGVVHRALDQRAELARFTSIEPGEGPCKLQSEMQREQMHHRR